MTSSNETTGAVHRTGNDGGSSAKTASPRAIVVLGMHRSGTSALTGSLRLCGAWIGDEDALTGSSAENPKGFWERRDIRNICDALLHGADADWWKVAGFDGSAVPHVVLSEQTRKFQAIVAELNERGVWALKEPRLSLLFPLLRSLMPDPVCILPYRHPLEVAQSLRWRNGFGIAEGMALWEAYTRSALRVSRGLPRFLVSYNKLVSEPHVELERICRKLTEFGVPGIAVPDAEAIDAFLTPSLYRQRVDEAEAADYLQPTQSRLWAMLESGEALDDNLSPDLPQPTRVYLRDLESRIVAKNLQAAADKAKSETRELRSELKASSARSREYEERLAALTQERDAQKAKAEELAKTITIVVQARDAEATTVSRLTKEIEASERAYGAEKARVEELTQSIARLTSASAQDSARVKGLTQELEELQLARNSAQARCDVLAKEKRAYEAEHRALQDKLEWRLKSLNRLRDKFNARERQAEALANDLAQERKANKRIQNSLSWRLTKPLRAAGRLMGRGKRSPAPSGKSEVGSSTTPEGAPRPAPTLPVGTPERTKPASSAQAQAHAVKLTPEEMRKERNKAISKARKAGSNGDWHAAAMHWTTVAENYADREDVVALARFNLSIADRIDNIERVKAQINDYNRAKSEAGRRPRIAIFTAIAGGYDTIKLPQHLDPRFDYVLFTDRPVADTGVFDVRPLPYHSYDPTRSARFVKTHPHMLLPDYDLAIWIDGNILILDDIWPLIEAFEQSGKDLAAIPHPLRTSIEEEVEACVERGKDEAEIMKAQVEAYLEEGFKSGFLIESNLLMFNLKDGRLDDFLALWWKEIDHHSRRDQLSLPYAIERTGIDWLALTEPPDSVRNHPSFALVRHDGAAEAQALLDALGAPDRDPIAGKSYASVRAARITAARDRSIDIVVCVHNALDDVRQCLQSVEDKRGSEKQRLILVNDGSDQPTTQFLADFAASRDWVDLQHSEVARGYTKAANAGLAATSAEFVILLNSDTIVTDDWAEKMADAVFSTPGAGLVGPLSNAASYQSIPDIKGKDGQTAINALPPGVTPDDLNRLCEDWTVDGILPRVPLVHGFCYGITRAVIDRIGMFDQENFPRGYGEENDYCFRAVNAGFSLVVATHTYVFHAKSKSYGTGRSELTKAGRNALRNLHTPVRISRATNSLEVNALLQHHRAKATN